MEEDNIGKTIENIYAESEELRKETNLSAKIKKHENVKKKISAVEQSLYKLRDIFDETPPQVDKQDIISDEKYEKNMRIINKLRDSMGETIEEQIESYKKFARLVDECEIYLKSKKMTLIKCDDEPTSK